MPILIRSKAIAICGEGNIIYRFIKKVRKPAKVSNLNPISKGKKFLDFLAIGNNLFTVLTIVSMT